MYSPAVYTQDRWVYTGYSPAVYIQDRWVYTGYSPAVYAQDRWVYTGYSPAVYAQDRWAYTGYSPAVYTQIRLVYTVCTQTEYNMLQYTNTQDMAGWMYTEVYSVRRSEQLDTVLRNPEEILLLWYYHSLLQDYLKSGVSLDP